MGGCTSQLEPFKQRVMPGDDATTSTDEKLLNWCPVSSPFQRLYELLEQNLLYIPFSFLYKTLNGSIPQSVILLLDSKQKIQLKVRLFGVLEI